MNTDDDWLTAEQAAVLLGIQRRSVYHYARHLAGFPQPRHIGRTPTWSRAELVAWRKAHPARHKQA